MLEKKVIKFPSIDNEKIRFETDEIIIIPYISLSDKMLLIPEYIETLHDNSLQDSSGNRYLIAEYSLIIGIIDKLTNVNIDNIEIESVFSSGLWNDIKAKIYNYGEFRNELDKIIELSRFEENLNKSVGQVLDRVSNKIIEVLDKIANSDLKSEELQEISSNLINELEKINTTAPGIISGSPIRRGRKPKSSNI